MVAPSALRWIGLLAVLAGACGPAENVDRVDRQADAQPAAGAGGGGGTGAGGTGGLPGPGGSGGAGAMAGGTGSSAGGGTAGGGATAGSGGAVTQSDAGSIPDAMSLPADTGSSPDTIEPDTAPEQPLDESLLKVTHQPAAASTNLTTLGALDWRHFGRGGGSGLERKRNGQGIVGLSGINITSFGHYTDRPVTFSWSDGQPTTSASNVPDGIVAGDTIGRGFELRVAGDPERARTLKVFVGVWQGTGRFTAELDGAASTFSDNTLAATDPGADRVYTVIFQPTTETGVLTVRWTLDSMSHMYGNVTIQAATLSE